MNCPSCEAAVEEDQLFCQDCGGSLKGVTDPTQPLVIDAAEQHPTGDDDLDVDLLGAADMPTREITPRTPIPDPSWAIPTGEQAIQLGAPVATTDVFDDLTTPTPAHPAPAIVADAFSTTVDVDAPPTSEVPIVAAAVAGAVGSTVTGEIPAITGEIPEIFDGSGDVYDYPPQREPFRLKLVFVLAFFGAVALLMTTAADLIDIRTTLPVNGITTGTRTLDLLGTNLAIAGFSGAAVMTLGALLACFGFRWGAGLAGGAGLALLGWAGLVLGLAELEIATAESITRNTSDVSFTLNVTRDLGFWLVVAVGVIGLLVFVASLGSIGRGGNRPLNPWVAALGAVAGVVAAAGPLIPKSGASFSDNFQSTSTALDSPTAFFAGRLLQLALIAVTVVVGLLIVRAYGLGLAAGGISVSVWLWISSLVEIGDVPLGIAFRNFGDTATVPHAVTTVGMTSTLAMLLIAAVLAVVNSLRVHRR